jgi:hypothetical protein
MAVGRSTSRPSDVRDALASVRDNGALVDPGFFTRLVYQGV